MLPQPDWPEDHASKAAALLDHLQARTDYRLVRLNWAGGIVIVARIV